MQNQLVSYNYLQSLEKKKCTVGMAAAAAFRRLMWLTVGHGSMVTLSSDEAPSLSCYRTSTQVADAM